MCSIQNAISPQYIRKLTRRSSQEPKTHYQQLPTHFKRTLIFAILNCIVRKIMSTNRLPSDIPVKFLSLYQPTLETIQSKQIHSRDSRYFELRSKCPQQILPSHQILRPFHNTVLDLILFCLTVLFHPQTITFFMLPFNVGPGQQKLTLVWNLHGQQSKPRLVDFEWFALSRQKSKYDLHTHKSKKQNKHNSIFKR